MMRKVEIGSQHGFLTVISEASKLNGKRRWLCRCDCGNNRTVTTGHLGKEITHCGCKKHLPKKYSVDQVFHNWTIVGYAGRSRYICRCVCGTEKEVCSRELQNGDSKSCGCLPVDYPFRDIKGQRFGRLTAIEQCGVNKHRNLTWRCRCTCGSEVIVPSGLLIKGHSTSCGCLKIDIMANKPADQKFRETIKSVKKRYKIPEKVHWKTGELLVCGGSWEPLVLDYLNEKRIDYKWQIPVELPNRKLYIIDLYLKEENLWVEIKGYARESFLEKWALFQKMHSNSIIWDKFVLKDMGIL